MSSFPSANFASGDGGGNSVKIATLYFIRHGIAWHNVSTSPPPSRPVGQDDDDDFSSPSLSGHFPTGRAVSKHGDPRWKDPPLVPDGEGQVIQAGKNLSHFLLHQHNTERPSHTSTATSQLLAEFESQKTPQPLLLITSPLTRCIQTATAIMREISNTAAEVNSVETQDRCPKRYPFLPPSQLLCVEDIREAYGIHYPDCRRRRSLLEKEFPHVDFDTAGITERDERWKPASRETVADVTNRVNKFLYWLANTLQTRQLEQASTNKEPPTVVVVSHGVWIECCLLQHCPQVLNFGQRRVHNCYTYKCDLVLKSNSNEDPNVRGSVQLESVSLVLGS